MQAFERQSGVLYFDRFEIDVNARELRREGKLVPLQDKPFDVLVLLVERAGELVSREAIRQRLWGRGNSSEFDDSLNHAVRKLREALEDSAENPRFIKTLPRRGYRLVAPVSGGVPASPLAESRAGGRSWPRWRIFVPVLCAIVLIASGVWAVFSSWTASQTRQEAEQAYQLGMHYLRQRRWTTSKLAGEQFSRAIELRPDFARAYAGLAESSSMIHPEDRSMSVELAERSVRLDPNCGECQAVLGYLRFTKQWRWQEAGRQLRRAASLAPRDPQIRFWNAQLQAILGRPGEALRLIDDFQGLEPSRIGLNLHVLA